MSISRPSLPDSDLMAVSPQQFHRRVEAALRIAMTSSPSNGHGLGHDDEGMRMLFGLLHEVPTCVPGSARPPFVASMLVGGVRQMIARREAGAGADSEQLLADLLEFVLAFYPEAVAPPLLSE
jgi:hypothetical protein